MATASQNDITLSIVGLTVLEIHNFKEKKRHQPNESPSKFSTENRGFGDQSLGCNF